MTDVHIINHTHWDREWFLTHEYTTQWIPPLIDSLEKLASENVDYEFLLDGQTLAIEDLAGTFPDYVERASKLIAAGNLDIGPLYSQPDWRLTSGELHLRNLEYGGADARLMGGQPTVAWLVDTFGHLSQAPQMLRLAGLDAAYVWRGVPQMTPLFRWEGPDGTVIPAVDLFGGYRNLYGVTKTAEIAVLRLVAETEKLAPSYGALPIPLFDGYDLDTEPEDPTRYYADLDVPASVNLIASSPQRYAQAMMEHLDGAPTIRGELISGKFGSTFPGTLSSRMYLKISHHDAEHALHRRIEPLSALAAARGVQVDLAELERRNRELLQNAVHDCICGVSIDQVHERMERSYIDILRWADNEQQSLTSSVLNGFASGYYAVSTAAAASDQTLRAGDSAVQVQTAGVGVSSIEEVHPVEVLNLEIPSFNWKNDHYEATVDSAGIAVMGSGRLCRLVVREDDGDTYSSEPGAVLGELGLVGTPILVDKTEIDATVRTEWALSAGDIEVLATVDARFDAGPVVDLTVTIDSTGCAFRVDAEFETSVVSNTVHASMPFDVIERPHEDNDLLPAEIDPELAGILMGQRDVDWVTEFPFQDYVAMTDGDRTAAVLAKGVRSYLSDASGTVSVALRRSVEWLASTGLKLRSGDAGPAMYVPSARCERSIVHRLGFTALSGTIGSSRLWSVNEAFQNPPIVALVAGNTATDQTSDPATRSWQVFAADLPLTAFRPTVGGEARVHLFNPGDTAHELGYEHVFNSLTAEIARSRTLGAKQILLTDIVVHPLESDALAAAEVSVLTPIAPRIGASRSTPDSAVLDELATKIAELASASAENEGVLAEAEGDEKYRLEHHRYVLDRERVELELSLELNQRRVASNDVVSIPDDADPIIADIGKRLNDLRVRRRIFDYVVQALG